MLAASPVLRKSEPSANSGNAIQSSTRYGSHPTSTQSPNHQSALVFVPTNSMTFQPHSGRMARPSASSHLGANYHEVSNQHGTAAGDDQAAASSPTTRQPYSAESSSAGAQRETESNEDSAGIQRRPDAHHQTQAQSPSIKRRQSATPPANTSTIAQRVPSSSPLKRPKTEKKESKILPVQYELCDVEDIVILIADMIAELIQTNDNLPLQDGVLTRFHSRTPPGISVIDYLQRLAKHAALTPPLLLSMVYYIDLLCARYTSFTVTTLTVHRFLITAATVAAKGLSDSFWNNSTYARVGGIKLAELGLLELDFLHRVDWRIVPTPEVLVTYYLGLVTRSDKYELDGDHRTNPSDVAAKAQGARETASTGSMPSAGDGGLENVKTDKKWERWMKDVADEADK